MNPAFLDEMSWEMAEVYGAVNDRILINLAKFFPYFKESNLPASTFAYQSAMLAQMGQVNRETVQIIRQYLGDADSALQGTLETAIVNSIEKTEPQLWQAAKKGILMPPTMPIVAPNQLRAFQLYYKQSADRLNLVNTVMLESTRNAYTAAVSDIVGQVNIQNRIDATQSALNIGAGETITGVESWNRAADHAIKRMSDKGITGFIDHAGRQWSAEAYAAMDIRTTVFNVGRAAVWEQNENFGNDLYVVSYHSGARPLCYPWQLKVISSTNNARTVLDLDGEEVEVIAQDATSYGEAAGLFGVNCQHYATPFIPGVSKVTGEVQDKETNDRIYAESQEQRRLERKLREEKRDLEMLKSRGAPEDQIAAQRARVKQSSQDINNFCEETGRARHRDREAVRTQRSFPSKDSYDVTQFEHAQQERIREYYQRGGAQQRFNFGTLVPNAPITPATPQTPTTPPVTSTAQQAGQYTEDMFQNVKGVDETFQKGMARTLLDSGNDDAIRLYGKYADNLVCVNPNASATAAHYSPIKGGVTMNVANVVTGSIYETPFEVAFHEFAHMIDDLATPGKPYYLSNTELNGKRLLEVIKSDYKAFKKSLGAKTNDELLILLKAEPMAKDGRICGNISDILEKCTNRSYPLHIGHGVSYHKIEGKTEREFFAEVLDSSVANKPAYEQMKRLFPNAVDMVWELVRGVI